jgi:hypothetical protein
MKEEINDIPRIRKNNTLLRNNASMDATPWRPVWHLRERLRENRSSPFTISRIPAVKLRGNFHEKKKRGKNEEEERREEEKGKGRGMEGREKVALEDGILEAGRGGIRRAGLGGERAPGEEGGA